MNNTQQTQTEADNVDWVAIIELTQLECPRCHHHFNIYEKPGWLHQNRGVTQTTGGVPGAPDWGRIKCPGCKIIMRKSIRVNGNEER